MHTILLADVVTADESNDLEQDLIRFILENEDGEKREYPYLHPKDKVIRSLSRKHSKDEVESLNIESLTRVLEDCYLVSTVKTKTHGEKVFAKDLVAGTTYKDSNGEIKQVSEEDLQDSNFFITIAQDGLRLTEELMLRSKTPSLFQDLLEEQELREERKRLRKEALKKEFEA